MQNNQQIVQASTVVGRMNDERYTERKKQPMERPIGYFCVSTNLQTVLFIFLNECLVVRGHHRMLFGCGVQVLFAAIHRIHGPGLTADREGNGFDLSIAVGMEGANLRFQKEHAASVCKDARITAFV